MVNGLLPASQIRDGRIAFASRPTLIWVARVGKHPKNKKPRPRSGRTFLHPKVYQTNNPPVKPEITPVVIRRTNDPNLRYEMFKRLNAGGSPAEAHEVRNASLRIVGPTGEAFLKFLDECSKQPFFEELTETLSEQAKHRLGSQELVLRFFALKNSPNTYKGSISDWLDDYSESVAKRNREF